MRWVLDKANGVEAEIRSLPPRLQAKLVRLLETIEGYGVHELNAPHARHLEGELWELRLKSDEGIARGLYAALSGRRVVVLHVFKKTSQKTPLRALALARERLKQVKK